MTRARTQPARRVEGTGIGVARRLPGLRDAALFLDALSGSRVPVFIVKRASNTSASRQVEGCRIPEDKPAVDCGLS